MFFPMLHNSRRGLVLTLFLCLYGTGVPVQAAHAPTFYLSRAANVADSLQEPSNAGTSSRSGGTERIAKAQRHGTSPTDSTAAPFFALTLFETTIDVDSLIHAWTADTMPAPDTVMPLEDILGRLIHESALDSLIQTRLAYYKHHPTQGYSVLFFSASGNHSGMATQQAEELFQTLYPDTPTYLSYDAPYYKLKAGNFRTRLEASAFLAQIQNDYPNAFVVRDVLDIKHLLNIDEPKPTEAEMEMPSDMEETENKDDPKGTTEDEPSDF